MTPDQERLYDKLKQGWKYGGLDGQEYEAIWHLLDLADELDNENERLRAVLTRAAADLRHGLAHPTSAGILGDVVRRLERTTTPNADARPPAGQPGAKPWPGHGEVAKAPTNPPAAQPGPLKAEHRFYPVGTHEEEDD
jgi:hypothetical protein